MKRYIVGLCNEIKVEWIIYFQNKAAVLFDLASYVVLYLFFVFMKTGSSLPEVYGAGEEYASVLLLFGYIIWMLCSRTLTCISSEILYEANKGLLFYKITSVTPLAVLYLGKMLAIVAVVLIHVIPIGILAVLFFDIPAISGEQILKIVGINCVVIAGMYGLGLILASFTMANKRLSRVSLLISSVLLFTSNALTYEPRLGKLLQYFPANYGIDFTRRVIADRSFWSQSSFLMLAITVVLLIVGSVAFSFSIKQAKKAGNILWY